ncbi:hypothetical protein [Thiomicrospira sp. WB1]|uniref:hypothetical protein n=1 Tax=Thiomicrospira sp. WB1 TaxID=1685380 RepID=UPI000747FF2F|nr:hypothetical protein [Thiomicrospira sp. WB1]KUJ71668.1 hypothetical protein AVO41_09145 [Thiomicrospira sp. WB1]
MISNTIKKDLYWLNSSLRDTDDNAENIEEKREKKIQLWKACSTLSQSIKNYLIIRYQCTGFSVMVEGPSEEETQHLIAAMAELDRIVEEAADALFTLDKKPEGVAEDENNNESSVEPPAKEKADK